MNVMLCVIIAISLSAVAMAAPADSLDKYGGSPAIKGKKTGFFHTEKSWSIRTVMDFSARVWT